MIYINGIIKNTGDIINIGYTQLDKLEVQYEGTDTWLDCKVTDNISNKSNTSFTIRVKDGQIVTTTQNMFSSCTSLTSLDLSNFDTSNVTNMNSMFRGCSKLTSLDLSNFDTSKVTHMRYMFSYCHSLTSLDLSSFNTSSITNIYSMFDSCNSLTSLDLSNFDTSKVTDMTYIFRNCSKLTSLDLSNWNINLSILSDYQNMLSSNSALEVINLSFANQDAISVIYSSVPSQAITVKVTLENAAYATDTAPNNVTVIVMAIMNINTTKQQLIYNIAFRIKDANIIPKTKEEIILYGIMMGQAVNIFPSSIKQELLLHISKGTQNANIVPQDKEELILYGIMMNQDVDVSLDTIVQVLYYTLLKKGV